MKERAKQINRAIVVLLISWAMAIVLREVLLPIPTLPAPAPSQSPQPLLEYAAAAVERSAPKLSPVRKKLIAQLVTAIAENSFQDRFHQEIWIALLGVESRFQGAAKSGAGAVGLGQLIPKYRQDFGKSCGLTEVDAVDLTDDYTNATLSACYFRDLIQQNGGNVPLALVSYNAGIYSPSLKNVKQGGSAVHETANYVTKIWVQHTNTLQQN